MSNTENEILEAIKKIDYININGGANPPSEIYRQPIKIIYNPHMAHIRNVKDYIDHIMENSPTKDIINIDKCMETNTIWEVWTFYKIDVPGYGVLVIADTLMNALNGAINRMDDF